MRTPPFEKVLRRQFEVTITTKKTWQALSAHITQRGRDPTVWVWWGQSDKVMLIKEAYARRKKKKSVSTDKKDNQNLI